MRELKKKAEMQSMEAKQTAQRVSTVKHTKSLTNKPFHNLMQVYNYHCSNAIGIFL